MKKSSALFVFYLGLIIMLISAASMYLVFSGKSNSISNFIFPSISLNSELLKYFGFQNVVSDTSIEVVPASIVNQLTNLIFHLVLMSFIGGIGYKISMLGAYLLRPVSTQIKDPIQETTT